MMLRGPTEITVAQILKKMVFNKIPIRGQVGPMTEAGGLIQEQLIQSCCSWITENKKFFHQVILIRTRKLKTKANMKWKNGHQSQMSTLSIVYSWRGQVKRCSYVRELSIFKK